MNRFLKLVSFAFFLFIVFFIYTPQAHAISYDLIPPSGSLKIGQEIQFIININTEGSTVRDVQIGMNYETQYVKYEGATAGDALTSLNVPNSPDPQSGQIILNGSNSSGFNGTGIFAYVKFKIIATSPGSTRLCALFAPGTTPAPTPTTPPVCVTGTSCSMESCNNNLNNCSVCGGMQCSAATNGVCVCGPTPPPQVVPTSPPQPIPTQLPKSGDVQATHVLGTFGALFFFGALGLLYSMHPRSRPRSHHAKLSGSKKH